MKNRHKQQILSSLLSLTLIACQVPPPSGPQTQKPSQNQTPVLLAPKVPDMPQKLKALVEQKGGNPAFVKVVPIQEMKDLFSKPQKPNAKRVERPLQKHFSLAQTGQESCDWSSMNICGYQEVGNWQEYYDAIYNDFASFYNGLCAYETKDYCLYDEGQACHLQTREMQFYGCSCRDGYEKTAEGCTRPLALKIKYTRPGSTTPDEGELMISPLQPNHPNNEIEIEVHDDGKHYWQMDIFNANGEQVFHRGGDPFAQEKVFKWSGKVQYSEAYLPDGVYTIRLSSNEQLVERNVRIENSLLFLVNYDVAADALPPAQEIMPFRPAQEGEPTAIRIQVFQQPGIPWELKYINAQGQVLESLSVESTPEINIRFWEGKDPQTGEYLPNGLYTIELVSNGETRVQKVLIDHQLKLTVKGISSLSEPPITENILISPASRPQPGVYNQLDIQVDGIGNQAWNVKILNEQLAVMFEQNGTQSTHLRWGGDDAQTGNYLPNGVYTVVLSSNGESKTQSFRIHNENRMSIRYNTTFPTWPSDNEELTIYPFRLRDFPRAYFILIDPIDTLAWTLDVFDAQGQKVKTWVQNESANLVWSAEGLVPGGFVATGAYTFVFRPGLSEIRRTVKVNTDPDLEIAFGSVRGGQPPDTQEVFLTPGKRDQILDFAQINVTSHPQQDWLLEIKDQGNSTVWYRRGRGSQNYQWEGTDQKNNLVAEGRYTVRLSSGNIQKSGTLKVEDLADPRLELYFDKGIQWLLDSIEPRLAVIKRDVETLVEETKAAYPQAPTFQIQSIPDIQGFRIQQQQAEPLPEENLNRYVYANTTDRPKHLLDAQNDRIVREVEILRQKIAWIKHTNQTFAVQQAGGGEAQARSDAANSKEKEFYGIGTSTGCFNYYSFKPRWKRPLRDPDDDPNNDGGCEDNDNDPNTQCPGEGGNGGGGKNAPEAIPQLKLLSATNLENGTMEFFGRMENKPDGFSFQTLRPVFVDNAHYIQIIGQHTVTELPNDYFQITLPRSAYEYTQAYGDLFWKENLALEELSLSVRVQNYAEFLIQNNIFLTKSEKLTAYNLGDKGAPEACVNSGPTNVTLLRQRGYDLIKNAEDAKLFTPAFANLAYKQLCAIQSVAQGKQWLKNLFLSILNEKAGVIKGQIISSYGDALGQSLIEAYKEIYLPPDPREDPIGFGLDVIASLSGSKYFTKLIEKIPDIEKILLRYSGCVFSTQNANFHILSQGPCDDIRRLTRFGIIPFKKLTVDIGHILKNHTHDGSGYQQSLKDYNAGRSKTVKDVYDKALKPKDIEKAIKEAYNSSSMRRLGVQDQEGKEITYYSAYSSTYDINLKIYVEFATKTLKTAFPQYKKIKE
jgi:flagellar hook assembly protein FlgD